MPVLRLLTRGGSVGQAPAASMVAGVRGRQRPAPPAPAGTPALRSQEARSLLQREKRLALLYTHTPSPKRRFPGLASDS